MAARLMVTRAVAECLATSPFQGGVDWTPVEYGLDSRSFKPWNPEIEAAG